MIEKIISIHQPSYFPWLGLIDKINKSEKYIYMDEVQLSDSSFQNRNIFLTNDFKIKFLNVNISKKFREKKISDLTISNPNWYIEHKNFLTENYRKHDYFGEIITRLNVFFEKNKQTDSLNTVLYNSMIWCFDILDIKTEVVRMSEMNYDRTKKASDLVKELVIASNYSTYLSGVGGKNYMNLSDFANSKIEVVFQEFKHPIYKQRNVAEFVQGLSVLDLLFNCGIDQSKEIIRNL